MAKKCAFCTEVADSGEHIFSAWMLRMIPPKERYLLREWNPRAKTFHRYTVRRVNLKAKVVCENCNHTWMSELENRYLKPAIKNMLFSETPCLLKPEDISAIAAFAFKTLVVANHKDLVSTPFFPFAVRRKFRLELCVPNNVHIWMSTRKTLPGKYYGFWKSAVGGIDQKNKYSFRLYACTWNFQNIVLQALATKWDDKKRRNTLLPITFRQPPEWDPAATLIWPPTSNNEGIVWPPAYYLGDNTIEAFTDRWNKFGVNIVE